MKRMSSTLYVIKRNGARTEANPHKITKRIENLIKAVGAKLEVDIERITAETMRYISDGTKTCEIDDISAYIAGTFNNIHPDYNLLGGMICMANLHKTTPAKFSTYVKLVQKHGIFPAYMYEFVLKHEAALDAMIDDKRDYMFTYTAASMLKESYLHKLTLTKSDGKDIKIVVSRPQYMYLAVALSHWAPYEKDPHGPKDDAEALILIEKSYRLQSLHHYTHATPTLSNIGLNQISCFLLNMDDTTESIKGTESDAAKISKNGGGLAITLDAIRDSKEKIRTTGGKACGIIPIMKGRGATIECFDQGGRRKGVEAVYKSPMHPEFVEFLKSRSNKGSEAKTARSLFIGVWMPNLFYKRAAEGRDISVFSESTAPGLMWVYDGMDVCSKCGYCYNPHYRFYTEAPEYIAARQAWIKNNDKEYHDYITTGRISLAMNQEPRPRSAEKRLVSSTPTDKQRDCAHAFESKNVYTELYEMYEKAGFATETYSAAALIEQIADEHLDNGTPYICLKDVINTCSNQNNIGTVCSSNLCTEIMEVSTTEAYAVCCLATINLVKYVVEGGGYDFLGLFDVTRYITRALNQILCRNKYPVPQCEVNVRDTGTIGIGIQGLQNVFALCGLEYMSPAAEALDLKIAETIYYAFLTESNAMAVERGAPYPTFAGSPLSRGLFHFDLWHKTHPGLGAPPLCGDYDWDGLRQKIMRDGVVNALGVTYPPTVSTSQILGNNESFEAYPSLYYVKNTLIGSFCVAEPQMIKDLAALGIWDKVRADLDNKGFGTIQDLDYVPAEVRSKYKTSYELSQKAIMDRANRRQAFIDQSQSLNIHWPTSNRRADIKMIEHAGAIQLKTGNYYVRSRPATRPQPVNKIFTKKLNGSDGELTASGAQKIEITLGNTVDLSEGESCNIGCTLCSS